MIASAYQSGMMDYTIGARQQMEAHKQIFSLQGANRIYQMDPTQGGQLFTSVLAAGTPANQAGGAYIEALRAQSAGVPLGQSMGALGTANQYLSFMQQTGNAGPNTSTQGYSGGLIQGQLVAQKLQNDGYIVTEQQRASFGSIVTQLNAMNGKTDRDRIDNAVMASQLAYGQAAAHIDGDFIASADARQKYMDHEQVALSERMSAGRLSMERMMDPRSLIRDALGAVAGYLPGPAQDFVNRATGYGPYKPGEASGLNVSPGAVGSFSKNAWDAYPTSGKNMAAAGKLNDLNDARAAADEAIKSGRGQDAFDIMGKAGGTGGAKKLGDQLKAYIGGKDSNSSQLKNKIIGNKFYASGVLLDAAFNDGRGTSAMTAAAQNQDTADFLGKYKDVYYGTIEKNIKDSGDPVAGAASLNDIYTGAGLKSGENKDNDAYLGALSKITHGMDPGEALHGMTKKQQSKFADRFEGMSTAETSPGNFSITGHNMKRDVEQMSLWSAQKQAQSGAIGNALPGIMAGIGGRLNNAISGETDTATKAALQGYQQQFAALSDKSRGDQVKGINAIKDAAGKGGLGGSRIVDMITNELATASAGTGEASAMASMPFAAALQNAANALSVLGMVAGAIAPKGQGNAANKS
jgi:hypothetical protein